MLQFWLPLLGLFTGARLNELCQLDFVPVHGFETPICAYAAMSVGPI